MISKSTSARKATPSLNSVQRKIAGAGYTLTDICDATGVSNGALSQVASGKARWANVQQAIADAIGTTPPALFGDLCHPSLRKSRERAATTPPRTAEVAA